MKKQTILIIGLLCLMPPILSQTEDQILDKHHQAHDYSARENVSGLLTTGYFTMSGTELQVPFKLYQRKPDHIRIESSFFGVKMIQTYNGEEAWLLNPTESPQAREADREDLEVIAITTAIDGPFMMYRERGFRLDYQGEKDFRGKVVHAFRLAKAREEYIDIFLDPDTYLIKAVKYSYKRNGGWYSQVYETNKYEQFAHGTFPTEIIVSIHGVEMSRVFVKRVETRDDLSDDYFSRPGS